MKYIITILLSVTLFIFSACTRTHELIIPSDRSKWDDFMSKVTNLPEEEKELLIRYMNLRQNSKNFPVGITVAKAIELQAEADAKKQTLMATQTTYFENLEKERYESIAIAKTAEESKRADEELANLLKKEKETQRLKDPQITPVIIRLIGIKKSGHNLSRTTLSLEIENQTDKDIKLISLKGAGEVLTSDGRRICYFGINSKVPAKSTITEDKLYDALLTEIADLDNTSLRYVISEVVFSDGTRHIFR